ncbi:MAG: helix-turn-helix domain-containing protein [Oscillospiraceae bacterium]|nr:helix-turn-helix domain-containing protein [Oscillospiraceae bacterium]
MTEKTSSYNSSELRQKIGRRIAVVRRSKGVRQEELAKLLGVDRTTMCFWESGKRAISAATLLEVASILDVDTPILLGESSDLKCSPTSLGEAIAKNTNGVSEKSKESLFTLASIIQDSPRNEARDVLIAELLKQILNSSVFSELYTRQEIEEYIQEEYGIDVRDRSIFESAKMASDLIKKKASISRIKLLLYTVERELYRQELQSPFPQEVDDGIQKRLKDLQEYLISSGFDYGAEERAFEIKTELEELQDPEIVEGTLSEFVNHYDCFPSRSDYEEAFSDGYHQTVQKEKLDAHLS